VASRAFPPDHPVTLIWTDGSPDYKTQALAMELKNLVWEYGNAKYYSSLFVPPLCAENEKKAFFHFRSIDNRREAAG
jgi:hypothetical protein